MGGASPGRPPPPFCYGIIIIRSLQLLNMLSIFVHYMLSSVLSWSLLTSSDYVFSVCIYYRYRYVVATAACVSFPTL